VTHRILTGVIVCFWLVMTFELVRLEINPDRSDLLTVPPSHVLKLMFTHGQTSELDVVENGSPVGNMSLTPKTDSETDNHSLDFSGNILVRIPNAPKKQRVSWDGILKMDHSYKTSNLQLTVNLLPVNPREIAYHVHLNLDPVAKEVEYEVKEGDQSIKKSSFSADTQGVSSLLRDEFGLDTTFLANIHSNIATPTLSAKQTEIKIRTEKTIAYLLSIEQGETVVAEIYVSQLGQILTTKTIFGYNLNAADTLP